MIEEIDNSKNRPGESCISFMNSKGELVGELDWTNGDFTFKGKVKPSAEKFFQYLWELGRKTDK